VSETRSPHAFLCIRTNHRQRPSWGRLRQNGLFVSRWAYRNWEKQDETIRGAELRREKIIYSEEEFRGRRVREVSAEQDKLFKTARRLQTRAARRKQYAVFFTLLLGVGVLFFRSLTAALIVFAWCAALDLFSFSLNKRDLRDAEEAQAQLEALEGAKEILLHSPFCDKCGSLMEEDWMFCEKCGAGGPFPDVPKVVQFVPSLCNTCSRWSRRRITTANSVGQWFLVQRRLTLKECPESMSGYTLDRWRSNLRTVKYRKVASEAGITDVRVSAGYY
jgi:hypothetical protein